MTVELTGTRLREQAAEACREAAECGEREEAERREDERATRLRFLRDRLRAILGVEPEDVTWVGDHPVAYVDGVRLAASEYRDMLALNRKCPQCCRLVFYRHVGNLATLGAALATLETETEPCSSCDDGDCALPQREEDSLETIIRRIVRDEMQRGGE